MLKTRGFVVGLTAAGFAAAAAAAQNGHDDAKRPEAAVNPAAVRPLSSEETAIRAMAGAFTKAFNAGDARAIAALHTPRARVVDATGEVVEGREAIEREYAGLFKDNPGLAIEIRVEEVLVLSPDSATEEGTTRVSPKEGGAPVVNRYSAVQVKQDGRWLLASVRETPGENSTSQDRLGVLEWMLGDWVDESRDSVIHSTAHWADDKQAILREFTIRSQGKVVMTGTQRIGWDPRAGQIKSWEFDSEGGHGESLWARLGNHWVVKASGVLQDGRTATATHTITPEDPSTCRWRTTDRTVGGDVIPVVDEFVMVRPAPGPRTK